MMSIQSFENEDQLAAMKSFEQQGNDNMISFLDETKLYLIGGSS